MIAQDQEFLRVLAQLVNGVVRHRVQQALGSLDLEAEPDDPDVAALHRLLSAVSALGPDSAAMVKSGAAQPAERTLDAP